MAIVDSTTSLTVTREDTTEPWMQNLKQFIEKNNGMVFMQKQNGKTYMNYIQYSDQIHTLTQQHVQR